MKVIFLSCSTLADLVMAIWLHSNRYTPTAWQVFKWASVPACSVQEKVNYNKLLRCIDTRCALPLFSRWSRTGSSTNWPSDQPTWFTSSQLTHARTNTYMYAHMPPRSLTLAGFTHTHWFHSRHDDAWNNEEYNTHVLFSIDSCSHLLVKHKRNGYNQHILVIII